MRADLADMTPRAGHTRLVSTLTGDWVDPASMTADYWYDNLRQTVHFDAGGHGGRRRRAHHVRGGQPAPGADDAGHGDPRRHRRRPGTPWAACAAATTTRPGC